MKEKILAALKTKFVNLGFGEKAFTGVAEFLSTTVPEETQIETAIAGVEPLLKAFQGDTDSRVTTALAKQKAELEKKPDAAAEAAAKAAGLDDIKTIVANAIKAAVEPLQQKIEGYEQRETQKVMQTRVLSTIREGLKTEPEKKSFDIWIKGRAVTVASEDKLDETISSIKTGFNEFRQEMINQGIITDIPASSKQYSGGVDDFIDTMKEINKTDSK